MYQEIAQIDVKPGAESHFEQQVAKARPLFLASPGCHGVSLHRSVEQPSRYRLIVLWATVEAHTVDFRGSDAYTQWRTLVGDCFATPPQVEHTHEIPLD